MRGSRLIMPNSWRETFECQANRSRRAIFPAAVCLPSAGSVAPAAHRPENADCRGAAEPDRRARTQAGGGTAAAGPQGPHSIFHGIVNSLRKQGRKRHAPSAFRPLVSMHRSSGGDYGRHGRLRRRLRRPLGWSSAFSLSADPGGFFARRGGRGAENARSGAAVSGPGKLYRLVVRVSGCGNGARALRPNAPPGPAARTGL